MMNTIEPALAKILKSRIIFCSLSHLNDIFTVILYADCRLDWFKQSIIKQSIKTQNGIYPRCHFCHSAIGVNAMNAIGVTAVLICQTLIHTLKKSNVIGF